MRVIALLVGAGLLLTFLPLTHGAGATVLVGTVTDSAVCDSGRHADIRVVIADHDGVAVIAASLLWGPPCDGWLGLPVPAVPGAGDWRGEGDAQTGWSGENIHEELGIFTEDHITITPLGDGTYELEHRSFSPTTVHVFRGIVAPVA